MCACEMTHNGGGLWTDADDRMQHMASTVGVVGLLRRACGSGTQILYQRVDA